MSTWSYLDAVRTLSPKRHRFLKLRRGPPTARPNPRIRPMRILRFFVEANAKSSPPLVCDARSRPQALLAATP